MKRFAFLVLAAVVVVTFMGCDNNATESSASSDVPVWSIWQCVSDPDIYISVLDRVEQYSYCGIHTVIDDNCNIETGAISIETINLNCMLNDGCWKQCTDIDLQFGPPPPGWFINRLSDKMEMGVRINGTVQMPMFIHEELPLHAAIKVTEPVSIGE